MRTRLWACSAAIAGAVLAGPAYAADHADGPAATQSYKDLSADITDVYTFNDASGNVVLIMDVGANATSTSKFSNAVQYVFHIDGITGLTDTTPYKSTVVCTFDASNKISCWVQNGSTTADYVTGDATPTAGLASADGKIKVFAGPRNDPFFFNIQGFRAVTHYIATNIADFAATATPGGCPQLDIAGKPQTVPSSAGVRAALASQDVTAMTPGVDDFAKGGVAAKATPLMVSGLTGNILSLVVSVPKTMLTNNGAKTLLGVWASTNK